MPRRPRATRCTATEDLESDAIYPAPNGRILNAVFGAAKDEEAIGIAKFMLQAQQLQPGNHPLEAVAEVLSANISAKDFSAKQQPLFHLSRGTRTLYARSSWDATAFWAVFTSAPKLVPDHEHQDAGNFVFSRGMDHLLVDPSAYGSRSTLPSNAPTVDADTVMGDYKPSQTPWSKAELRWARGVESGVAAARTDYARAFDYSDTPSDVPFARRDWVFLPEGEIVVIDRVRGNSANEATYLNFHTTAELTLNGKVATATVGSSQIAIHAVRLDVTPETHAVTVDENCYVGSCASGRFASFAYSARLPGPRALGVHVIDGLAQDEMPAEVSSLNDAPNDSGGQNDGVLGAAVLRAMQQSYVIASSAQDGMAGATLSYEVPGKLAARHIVFDAPESSDGESSVATKVTGERCNVEITSGSGFAGHPLIFGVSSAADGCKVSEDAGVTSTSTPTEPSMGGAGSGGSRSKNGTGGAAATGASGRSGGGGGGGSAAQPHNTGADAGPSNDETGGAAGSKSSSGGCGCSIPGKTASSTVHGGSLSMFALACLRRRKRKPR